MKKSAGLTVEQGNLVSTFCIAILDLRSEIRAETKSL